MPTTLSPDRRTAEGQPLTPSTDQQSDPLDVQADAAANGELDLADPESRQTFALMTGNVKWSNPRESSDPADFEAVVTACWNMWVNWVMVRMYARSTPQRPANFADAEDLVQDAVISMSRSLHYYRPDVAPLSAWIMGALKLYYYQNRRGLVYDPSLKRPTLRFVGDAKLPNIGGSYLPDDDRDCPIDREAVRNAVGSLHETRRDVVTKRYFGGLNLREIGDTLGLTRQRVHQLLGDGHEKLRKSLASFAPKPAAV